MNNPNETLTDDEWREFQYLIRQYTNYKKKYMGMDKEKRMYECTLIQSEFYYNVGQLLWKLEANLETND